MSDRIKYSTVSLLSVMRRSAQRHSGARLALEDRRAL
jgi:hypothetical protein